LYAANIRKRLKVASLKHNVIIVLSAGVLIAGVFVTILPASGSDGAYKWYAVLMYSSANVTSTWSYLLKEAYLKDLSGSAVHVNVWNAIYMVPITFLLWPLQVAIPGFGSTQLSQLGSSFADGFRCFAGQDVEGCACSGAWASELVYCVSSFVGGCFALVMVKRGSAAFHWAANIVAVPLSGVVFAMKGLMPASAYQPFAWYVAVGFVLVVVGIAAYGITENRIDDDMKAANGLDVIDMKHRASNSEDD
jgi:hypothetical protein